MSEEIKKMCPIFASALLADGRALGDGISCQRNKCEWWDQYNELMGRCLFWSILEALNRLDGM